jgi:hypothetical protein
MQINFAAICAVSALHSIIRQQLYGILMISHCRAACQTLFMRLLVD